MGENSNIECKIVVFLGLWVFLAALMHYSHRRTVSMDVVGIR